jgi:hypothetical protein
VIFNGYIQLRRGLLEHLHDGRISLLEFAVLTVLITIASKETGSGTINANTLGSFIGDGLDYESEVPRNRQRGKQRILKNLEVKGYIFRQVVPHSKRAYRYWVDKYLCTDGLNKSRRLDLSQVRESQDIKDIRYAGAVAEPVAEGVAETVASNKKRKREEEKNYTSRNDAKNDARIDARGDATNDATEEGRTMKKAEHALKGNDANDARMTHAEAHDANDANRDATPRTRRVRIVPGPDAHYVDADSGERLRGADARAMLEVGTATEVMQ